MSITTFAELQTAAANWSSRTDLTSRIPEFIALAEAKMNRKLREKDMVTKDGGFAVAAEYVPVPASFGGVKTFYLNTTPRVPLEWMADHLMTMTFADGATGTPSKYNVQGSNFRFGKPPDAAYGATLVYYLKVPALSTSNTANWMLTNHPDAYTYGVMSELQAYLQDWQAAGNWMTAMYKVIDEIRTASNRDAHSGDAALAARPG